MIDAVTALKILLDRLERMPVGHGLDLRPYKRNRLVLLVKRAQDSFLVIERGFAEERFDDVPAARLPKLLKTVLRREFPRSTKLRLYDLGRFDESGALETARKKL